MSETVVVKNAEDTHGSLYWFARNIFARTKGVLVAHKVASVIFLVAFFVLVLLFREAWQPLVLIVRRFFGPILLAFCFIFAIRLLTRRSGWLKQSLVWMGAIVVLVVSASVYQYVALWVRFNSFPIEYLTTLPETDHERLLPLSAVHSSAKGNTGDSKTPTTPAFVWMKGADGNTSFRFTMGVEPTYWWDKILGSIEEVWSVPGTEATIAFTPDMKKKVRFAVGKGLWLSSNADTVAVRSFDPLRFLSYEPSDAYLIEDDHGQMIQIISLIRWRGILFPYPEFGGVLVIRQQPAASVSKWFSRVLFGDGRWIPPERIQDYPYLRGQNIMPIKASQYIAESFRFMNGFTAPLPGFHDGDVRIPEIKEDINPQPYTTFFKETQGLPGMLYHYFSLEPYLQGRHGLVASLLIPADGTDRVLVYAHERKGESLNGVSNVASIVRASRRTYNWQDNKPVEHRPYVKIINGKTQLFWLTTIVTTKDPKEKTFVSGGITEVTLTNAASITGDVTWVDSHDPKGWPAQLAKGLK